MMKRLRTKKRIKKKQLGLGQGLSIAGASVGLLGAPFRKKKMRKLQEDYNQKMSWADEQLASSRTNKYYFGDRDSTIAQLGKKPISVTDKQGRTFIQDSSINPDNIPNATWDTWSQDLDGLAKANAATATDESIKGKGKKADKYLSKAYNKFAEENFLQPLNLPSTIENFALDYGVKTPVDALMGEGYGDQAKKWTQRAYQQFIPITNGPSFMKSVNDYGRSFDPNSGKKEHLSNVISNALYSSPYGKALNTWNAYRFPTQIVGEEAGLLPEGYGSIIENTPQNIEGLVNRLGKNLGGMTTAGKVVRDGLVKQGKLQKGAKLSSSGLLIGGNYHNKGGTKVQLGDEVVEMEKGEVVSDTDNGLTIFSNVLPNKDKDSFAKRAEELERNKSTLEKSERSEAQNGIDLINLSLDALGNEQEQFKEQMGLNQTEYMPALNQPNDKDNDGINDAIMQKGMKKYGLGSMLANNAQGITGGLNMLSSILGPSQQNVQQMQNAVSNFQNPHAAQIQQNYGLMQKGKRYLNKLGVNASDLDRKQKREANRLAKRLIKDQKKGKRIKDNLLNDAYAKTLSAGNIDRAYDVYYDNTQRTWGAGNQVAALSADNFTPQLGYNDGQKVNPETGTLQMGIAMTPKDYTTGLKDSSKNSMLFPFQKGSKNMMTMSGMRGPILLKDENGTRLAKPGENHITQGTVLEKRLQLGLNQMPDLSGLQGNRQRVDIQGNPYMQTTNVNLGNTGTQRTGPNLPGASNQLTNQTPDQYMQSLLNTGYTPEQVQTQLDGGGTMLGQNFWEPYTQMYNEKYGNPATPTTRDTTLSPILGKIDSKGLNAPYKPSLTNPNAPQTVPTGTPNDKENPIGSFLKNPKTGNILNELGQNADLIAPFFLKDTPPPSKANTAYFNPELHQYNLQPSMDAHTNAMRQFRNLRGNAGTKNALMAASMMDRANATSNEMNRVDNLNTGILNDAALKNIGIQADNNNTNYQNQANRIMFENGRNAKRQQWAANLSARLQTKQRDKNAMEMDERQRQLYGTIYDNMPKVQYGLKKKKSKKKILSNRRKR